jgi:predicted kinase/GNAT superfamily N-acetyltransferase
MQDLTVQLRYEVSGSGETCRQVLSALPRWFGIPQSVEDYVAMADRSPTIVASLGGRDIGFLTLVRHSPFAAEVHVMGVLSDFHRHGIGTQMLEHAERLLVADGVELLQVKTLSATKPDEGYEQTRAFYLASGFRPLEELPDLWDPENPALQMVKVLSAERAGPTGSASTGLLVLITGLPGTGKSGVADAAARALGAAVFAHDWVMSGLRPYPELQRALDSMDPPGHRAVGWSILRALARSELRRGRSAVLDGVARSEEITLCRRIADEEAARSLLVVTVCSDEDLHRQRIEGRQRSIPGWYELSWEQVARSRTSWVPPADADLVLDAARPWEENAALLHKTVAAVLASSQ